ncbi:MAG: fatty acid desaturase [Gemmatimonadales bacterium]
MSRSDPHHQPVVGQADQVRDPAPGWRAVVARYQRPSDLRAVAQLATTLIPLGATFWLMHRWLDWSYLMVLALALLAAGLLVRTFVIMHDCGHGSFFRSRRANEIVGWVTGVLTLTPFAQWRKDHALHHASAGDLDRRGHGDVETITAREYAGYTTRQRLRYRLVRHPLVLLGLGPIYLMLNQRRLLEGVPLNRLQRFSVWSTNLAILGAVVGLSVTIGLGAVFAIYFPAIYLAAAAGIALFFAQHQFEETYWSRHEAWEFATAAIDGSSHLALNPVLRWFTGSIGLHHVHHLGPRIPNYRLQRCHDENPLFHRATRLTLRGALRTMRLGLWDEEARRLIRFADFDAGVRAGRTFLGHPDPAARPGASPGR